MGRGGTRDTRHECVADKSIAAVADPVVSIWTMSERGVPNKASSVFVSELSLKFSARSLISDIIVKSLHSFHLQPDSSPALYSDQPPRGRVFSFP